MALAAVNAGKLLQLCIFLKLVAANNNRLDLQNTMSHVDRNSFVQVWLQHGQNQNEQSSDDDELDDKELDDQDDEELDDQGHKAEPQGTKPEHVSFHNLTKEEKKNMVKIPQYGLTPSYIGCYMRMKNNLDFPVDRHSLDTTNSKKCMEYCVKKNRLYFALEDGGICKCGKTSLTDYRFIAQEVEEKKCGKKCKHERHMKPKRWCGSNVSMAVYRTTGIDVSWDGCFANATGNRLFSHPITFDEKTKVVTSTTCVEACFNKGFHYVALGGDARSCYCGGNSFGKQSHTASSQQCGNICKMETGLNPPRYCGTPSQNAIFHIKEKKLNDTKQLLYVYAPKEEQTIDTE